MLRVKYHPSGLLPRWFSFVSWHIEYHGATAWLHGTQADGREVILHSRSIVRRVRV